MELDKTSLALNKTLKRLWHNKKILLVTNLLVGILAIVYLLFFTKPYYESKVTILPELRNRTGLASSFNYYNLLRSFNKSPTLSVYQELMKSKNVLKSVALKQYVTNEYADSMNLVEYFAPKTSEEHEKINDLQKLGRVVRIIKGSIKSFVDLKTNSLEITVRMGDPKLSYQVANNVIESLDYYIRTQRKSFASEQIFYLEQRITQVKDSLNIVETQLKNFREENRIISQSPNMLLTQNRLKRNVEIMQAVYIELVKQIELAKLQEIQDTPVINIIEKAEEPLKKAGPNRRRTLTIVLLLSFVITVSLVLISNKINEYLKLMKSNW